MARLKPVQLAEFRAWFEEFEARAFDETIERDARSGKLDKLAGEAIQAYRKGRTRDL